MFEDSTFETMGRIQTRSRGWMMATLAFNSSILLALVIIPIIHPEMLPQIHKHVSHGCTCAGRAAEAGGADGASAERAVSGAGQCFSRTVNNSEAAVDS